MATQVIKIDKKFLSYLAEQMNFQNESPQYRKVKTEEIKEQLEKALQTGAANKQIEWIGEDTEQTNALNWWTSLTFKEQWNVSINSLKCPDALTTKEIVDIFKKEMLY